MSGWTGSTGCRGRGTNFGGPHVRTCVMTSPGSGPNWTGPSNRPFGRSRGSADFQPHREPQRLPGALSIPSGTESALTHWLLPDTSACYLHSRLFSFQHVTAPPLPVSALPSHWPSVLGTGQKLPSLSLLGTLLAPQKCQPMETDQEHPLRQWGEGANYKRSGQGRRSSRD